MFRLSNYRYKLINFFLFIFNFQISLNYITIPFSTINLMKLNKTLSSSDNFLQLLTNELYINISIGTPKQTIKSLLKMEIENFYISIDSYNKTNSQTHKKISKKKSEDIIYLNNNKYLINFYYNKKKYNYSIIGLQNCYIDNKFNFINSIKINKAIQRYTFSFEFKNNDNNNFYNEGNFILGLDIKNIKNIKIINTKNSDNWNINFDEINSLILSSNNDSFFYNEKNSEVELDINKPYITSVGDYEFFIYEKYFKELIYQETCFMKGISINEENDYHGYWCKSEIFKKLKFPNLYFYNKDLNYTFILDKNDLFVFNEDEKIFYFMLIFNNLKNKNEKWKLGIPFFKKYQFIFDLDKQLIGFINGEINMDNENKNNKENKNKVIEIILGCIFILIIIFIYLAVRRNKIRKYRMNTADNNYINYFDKRKNKENDLKGINKELIELN